MNNFIKYLLYLLPWFISSLIFNIDTNYYTNLNLPFFAPNPIIFPIIWSIIYITTAKSIYQFTSSTSRISTDYKIYLTINYLSNQLYTLSFFIIKNNFLAFCDCLIVFLSSLYLYQETKEQSPKSANYLIIYILWSLFATILSFTILLIN